MKQRISRRDCLRFGALAATGAALASCAAPPAPSPAKETTAAPTPAPAAEEGVTVTWWYMWPNLDPAIETIKASDDFKAYFGNNTLENKGNVAREALLTAIAAGTPPDGISCFDYANLWSRGAVTPVDDRVCQLHCEERRFS